MIAKNAWPYCACAVFVGAALFSQSVPSSSLQDNPQVASESSGAHLPSDTVIVSVDRQLEKGVRAQGAVCFGPAVRIAVHFQNIEEGTLCRPVAFTFDYARDREVLSRQNGLIFKPIGDNSSFTMGSSMHWTDPDAGTVEYVWKEWLIQPVASGGWMGVSRPEDVLVEMFVMDHEPPTERNPTRARERKGDDE